MKLTPLDIRHKEFRRSLRGYSDEEVDVFLDEVADEFERVFQENIDLKERNQRLDEQVAQFVSLKETLQKTLISAQQQSDEMRANARKEAELILKDADLKSRDIVNESYSEKQRVQQALTQLKHVEEDFRFKFRSLLEQHLNSLAADEDSEDRRAFRGVVAGMEGATPSQKLSAQRAAAASPQAAPAKEASEEKRVVFGAAAAAHGQVAARGPVVPAAEPASAKSPVMEGGQEGPPSAGPAARDSVPEQAAAPTFLAHEEPAVLAAPTAPADLETEPAEQGPGGETPRWLGRGSTAKPPLDASEGEATAGEEDAKDLADEPTDQGLEKHRKESSVRRFLFGSKGKEDSDEFLDEDEDRDFQW
jgi:cell division initiation protein